MELPRQLFPATLYFNDGRLTMVEMTTSSTSPEQRTFQFQYDGTTYRAGELGHAALAPSFAPLDAASVPAYVERVFSLPGGLDEILTLEASRRLTEAGKVQVPATGALARSRSEIGGPGSVHVEHYR